MTCSSVRCTSWTRGVDSDGTLMCMSAAAPTAPPSRPVSAIVCSAARARGFKRRDARSANAPLVVMPSATSPAGRAPRPGARTPGRTRSRCRSLVRTLVSVVSAMAAQRRGARARNRPTSSRPRAARRRRCRRCRTAAASRRCRSDATIAAAAATTGCGSGARRARAARSSRLSVARERRARHHPRVKPILLQVRAELLFGHLHRLGRSGFIVDLHRVVLAQRIALPSPPASAAAADRDGRRTRCRTDPRPRARASSPPARCR